MEGRLMGLGQVTRLPAPIVVQHCATCGMALRDAGEYHPYEFCVMKKAGLDPWQVVLRMNRDLGWVSPKHMPSSPPRVAGTGGRMARSVTR